MPPKDRIFLSFPGEHRELAQRIVDAFAGRKEVWYDRERMRDADRIGATCIHEAQDSRHLVAIVGAATKDTAYQLAELGIFASRSPDECILLGVEMGHATHILFTQNDVRVIRDEDRHDKIVSRVLDRFGLKPLRLGQTKMTLAGYRRHVVARFGSLVRWTEKLEALQLERIVVHPGLMEPRASSKGRATRRRAASPRQPLSLEPCEVKANKLEDLVEPGARLVLWGDPGSGKTTLFRHLAWSLANSEAAGVPICLRLADEGERKVDPLIAAARQMDLEPDELLAASAALRDLATRSGRYPVLLLDGLDEVPRTETSSVLEWAAQLPPEYAVLVSSRKQLVGQVPHRAFTEVEVRPLDPEQQRRLLDNLLSGTGLAGPLAAAIDDDARLRELARSPLLLTLLAVLVREDPRGVQGLPKRRGELFKQAVELLLRRGHGVVVGAPGVAVRDVQVARRLLGELALHLHTRGNETWSGDEVLSAVVALRGDRATEFAAFEAQHWAGGEFKEDMERNAGVFGPLDGERADWRFFHRTFREYLAANALDWGPQGRLDAWFAAQQEDIKNRHRSNEPSRGRPTAKPQAEVPESRWGEVHALLCGMVKDPRPLLEPLLAEGGGVGVRAVLDADGLTADDAAGLLLQQDDADWEHLESLMKGWDLEAEEKAEVLLEAVSPALGPKALGMVWFAVEQLTGGAPEREAFFTQAGRWPKGGPEAPETVDIPAGSFVMGATQAEWQRLGDSRWPDGIGERERPPHQVSLTRPYRLGVTPVTQAEYAVFDKDWSRRLSVATASRHPIHGVCWWEAFAYCRWLGGSLPTEAEWEYACRAGTTTAFWSGDTKEDLLRVAWVGANSEGRLPTVGGKPANPWGLHDMHGLVWEWCEDPPRTYDEQPTTDPRGAGPPAGARVVRGGSVWNDSVDARSAYRNGGSPSGRGGFLGFRVRLPPALERGSMEP